MNQDKETDPIKEQHVKDAYKLIDSWPEWKKNIAHLTANKNSEKESSMNKRKLICDVCGAKSAYMQIVTEKFEYKSQSVEIENYKFKYCDNCQELVVQNKIINKLRVLSTDNENKLRRFLIDIHKELRTNQKEGHK